MLFRLPRFWLLAVAGASLACGCRGPLSQSADSRLHPPDISARRGHNPDAPLNQDLIAAHAHYATGVALAFDRDPKAVDEFYTAALDDPSNETLVLEVSRELLRAGDASKALSVLKKSTEKSDASGNVYARLSSVYRHLHETNQALAAGFTAIEKSPRSMDGYRNVLLVYSETKQVKEARDVLDQAAKVSDVDSGFLVGLGELCVGLGTEFPAEKPDMTARAEKAFRRALKENPDDPEIQLRLADGFNTVGEYDEAAALYLDALKSLPDIPIARESIRAKLAEIYPRLKNRERAAELLETFTRENPTDPRAYYLLGRISEDETNYVKSAEFLSKAILLDPNFEPAYGDLASVQLAQDKPFEAKATLEAGRKKFPRSFVIEYLTGITDSHLNDFTNAVRHLTAAEIIAQATHPGVLKDFFYFQFGMASERMGDYGMAEKYFLKCLELSPDFDEAQNYLGFMWADHGTNLDRARDLIEKALKAEPENAAYLDSMAWVLYKLGRTKDALDFELKAVAKSPEEDAEIFEHLGDIYNALGEAGKARDAWKKSLAVEPNEELKKKLENGSK